MLKLSVEERLFNRVDKNGPIPEYRPELGPCWVWTGCLSQAGYGFIRAFGKCCYTHIVAYKLKRGDYPSGLELDHLCRNTVCCNPDHLDPVTHEENVRRGLLPGVVAARTEATSCRRGHKFTESNTRIRTTTNGKTYRQCWECIKQSSRDAWRRKNSTDVAM